MGDVIDFYETTPTYPAKLPNDPEDWEEMESEGGVWVYVVRKNQRGEYFSMYRYPKKEDYDA